MISIVTSGSSTAFAASSLGGPAPATARTPIDCPPVSIEPDPVAATAPVEYEIVLGRRQVASVSLVVLVLVVVFSAASYMIGKALAPGTAAVEGALPSPGASTIPAPVKAPAETPMLEATVVPPPVPIIEKSAPGKGDAAADAPLFADPANGAVYIQIGAVEKGIAMLLTEGLRSHGLASFVAPGPSERVFRVLIGPLPNPASFTRAKETVDLLGLSAFARKYQK